MAVLKVVLNGAGYPDPLNPAMEPTAFSGNNRKIYLIAGCSSTIIINGGGVGTTDWVDTNLDGQADNWSTLLNTTFSIVTGNGFVGNAQRCVKGAGTDAGGIYNSSSSYAINTSYQVTFKYRSSFNIQLWLRKNNVFTGGTLIQDYPSNTGNAVSGSATIIVPNDSGTWFAAIFQFHSSAASGDWFEIDEVNICAL